MGHHRNGEAALRWKKWKQAQDALQMDVALPIGVMETEDDWWDHLMHQKNVPADGYNHFYPLSQ